MRYNKEVLNKISHWVMMILLGLTATFSLYLIEPSLHYFFKIGIKKENKIYNVNTVYIDDLKFKKEKKKPKKKIIMQKEKSKIIKQKRMRSRFKLNLGVTSMFGGAAFGQNDLDLLNFEEGEVDKNAIIIRRVNPRYPAKALEDNVEMDIILRVLVRRDGSVGEIVPITEDNKYRFVNASINAVKRYKYKPAEYKGINVNQWIRINIYFRIEDE